VFRWIVGSSLKFRFLVVAIAAGLVAFGVDRFRGMPVDVFPEFAPPRVEIQTPCLGLSAAEVEELVTIPLEQAFNGLPALDVMRSKSVEQLSSILLQFERGTDLLEARQLVAERLAVATPTLPTWASPPVMLQPLSSTSRMMKIGISSKELSVTEMSMTAYWKIVARLLRVPGVAHVAIWGERLKMLTVQVEPERLRAHRVTLDQVMEVTADSLTAGLLLYSDGARIGTGGFIDTPNQRLQIRHISPVINPKVMAQVPVKVEDGLPLLLGDVAKVSYEHQPMIGDGIINDDIGLLLIVEKFPWANTLQVTHGVEAALDELRPGLPGMEIDHEIFRPATFIEVSIDNLTTALIIGAVLVILVLGAFLFEWRSALISAVAIPLSLVAAGLVFYLYGTTINVMVLAGFVIALGAVVDDAIIDIENIVRRLRLHRREGGDKSTATIILEASLEIRSAIVYATLIIVLAVVPVFFMEGLAGAFFQPLALSYGLAMLASMVVALTVTPALSLLLLADVPLERRESPLVQWLQHRYERGLARIIRTPRPAYVTVGAIVVLGVAVWPLLGHELLPSFKERDFLMHWLTKPGTSHPEMNRITIQGSRELRSIPGVRNFGAHIGQALIMDEVVGMYFGENWISIDPNVDYDETVAKIQEVVDGYPGLYRDVQTYLKERIREVLTGSGEAIVIRIYGPELEVLRSKADEVRDAVAGIDGIVDLHVELQQDIPQVEVEVDLEAAKYYGIKPGDVRRAAATLISGVEVGDIYEHHGRTYEVYLWSTPETRNSVSDIRELLIDTPAGGHIRLEDVADVRIAPVPNVIAREDMSRRINVEANVRGRDLGSVAQDVARTLETIEFPLGYHPELIGEYAELQAARQQLLIASVLAAMGIFLLLQMCFGSWRLAAFAFLTLPSALVGGVIAAFFSIGVISLGALVGFLTVFGIAARNSILLIDHCQHLERYEGDTFGPGLVLRGARERLSPILMTTLATAAGLLPLAVVGDIPGHEIEYPMAIVILGGLVTSTLLSLFVVPSLYLRFGGPAPQPATMGTVGSQPAPAAR
jgi:CzcA family heavy metal efflux pump